MLDVDSDIFLQLPGEERDRTVHPAVVRECGEGITALITEPGFTVGPGQKLLIYYSIGHDFLKQKARVTAVMDDDPSCPLVGLETTGEPVSADSRECYRVSTVRCRLSIALDGEKCQLTDISVQGFSAITERPFVIGKTVDATLVHDGETWTGRARVQSVKLLGDGRIRYGFLCLEDRRNDADLQRGLQKLSMEIQRQQLRRRRGKSRA